MFSCIIIILVHHTELPVCSNRKRCVWLLNFEPRLQSVLSNQLNIRTALFFFFCNVVIKYRMNIFSLIFWSSEVLVQSEDTAVLYQVIKVSRCENKDRLFRLQTRWHDVRVTKTHPTLIINILYIHLYFKGECTEWETSYDYFHICNKADCESKKLNK